MAIRNKYFIHQDPECPEANLWAEMKGTRCGEPLLEIYGNEENGPAMLVSFSFAEACRLQNILAEKFVRFSTQYIQEEKAE